MRSFHIAIHACPGDVAAGPAVHVDGRAYPTLDVRHEQQAEPMAVTFEQALEKLEQFDRMFIEPDGSFVWVGGQPDNLASWQLDGLLNDRGDRLASIELKGTCSAAAFQQILLSCGWPAANLMFQLIRESVFLNEEHTRRYLFGEPDGS